MSAGGGDGGGVTWQETTTFRQQQQAWRQWKWRLWLSATTQLNISLPHLHAAVSDDLRDDPVEGQLFVEGLDALVSRVVELPSPVKVQNVPEHLGVSVEEVFLRVLVVEKLLFWRAQQRVGVPVQSVLPCLEKWKRKKWALGELAL